MCYAVICSFKQLFRTEGIILLVIGSITSRHSCTVKPHWELSQLKRLLSLNITLASKFPMVLDRDFAEQYHKVTTSFIPICFSSFPSKGGHPKAHPDNLLHACVPLSVVSGNGSKKFLLLYLMSNNSFDKYIIYNVSPFS